MSAGERVTPTMPSIARIERNEAHRLACSRHRTGCTSHARCRPWMPRSTPIPRIPIQRLGVQLGELDGTPAKETRPMP